MDTQKQQAAERVKAANNILVTVSNNPSVDQLAACIGLTLSLNKMGKHATAVFSGHVPSTIEFLQPEKTLEKNTDSLRDFIIALDKSKADKLRYKVEDKVVKIFITPYKTSISDKDLEFSQGDFNVDVILAIGVHNQVDLDQAITSHGRILHDATVVTLNNKPGGELGSINWLEPTSSSLSELGAELIDALDKNLIDSQIATALLTGIVAETERFSNSKTSPRTMTISAELMTAGANQQLVATQLAAAPVVPQHVAEAPIAESSHDAAAPAQPVKPANDGTLEIHHDGEQKPAAEQGTTEPAAEPTSLQLPEPTPPAPEVEQHAETEPTLPEPEHHDAVAELPEPEVSLPAPTLPEPLGEESEVPSRSAPQIHIDEHGSLSPLDALPPKKNELPTISHHDTAPKMVLQPPTMGGQLTANTAPDSYDNPAFGLPNEEEPSLQGQHDLDHLGPSEPVGETIQPTPSSSAAITPADNQAAAPFLLGDAPTLPTSVASEPVLSDSGLTSAPAPAPHADFLQVSPDATLSEIEQDVHSSHLNPPPAQSSPLAFDPAAFSTVPAPGEPAEPAVPAPQPYGPAPDPFALPPAPVESAAPVQPPAPAPEPEPELPEPTHPDLQSARDAVMQAINETNNPEAVLPPVAALNAQPIDLGNNPPTYPPAGGAVVAPDPLAQPASPTAWGGMNGPAPGVLPAPAGAQPSALGQPGAGFVPDMPTYPMPSAPSPAPQVTDPNAPPPVPPPMLPPTQFSQPY